MHSRSKFACGCKRSKILVVDDNYYNLNAIKIMIKQTCKEGPYYAENGQLAFEAYQNNFLNTCCQIKIEMIIMDLQMPVMDGYKATENILAYYDNMHTEPKYSHIKRPTVFAMTFFNNVTGKSNSKWGV